MRRGLRRWLWLSASVLVLALILYNLSQGGEWRHFSWQGVWTSLVSARPGYLLAAVATTYLSYLIRAYRWGFFLNPIKRASFRVLFVGQILGFGAIYLAGRPGEIVRPAYIAKKEDVAFTSMAAVWLLERVYDTVFIALLFSVAIYWGQLRGRAGEGAGGPAAIRWVGLIVLLSTALLVGLLVFFRLRADRIKAGASRLLGFLSEKRRHHVARFLVSFAEGLEVIQNWRDLLASILSTGVLWIVNASFFWLVLRSMHGAVGELSWLAASLVLISSIMGMIVQLPGIGGGFQVVVIQVMTQYMGVSLVEATGASILLWVMLTLPCLGLGMALLVNEGLSFRKLEGIAEEERAALEEEA
jgi:glycosyltransferase 2 family protein